MADTGLGPSIGASIGMTLGPTMGGPPESLEGMNTGTDEGAERDWSTNTSEDYMLDTGWDGEVDVMTMGTTDGMADGRRQEGAPGTVAGGGLTRWRRLGDGEYPMAGYSYHFCNT
jgi:hypothetical protein